MPESEGGFGDEWDYDEIRDYKEDLPKQEHKPPEVIFESPLVKLEKFNYGGWKYGIRVYRDVNHYNGSNYVCIGSDEQIRDLYKALKKVVIEKPVEKPASKNRFAEIDLS
jgi:hypothetical protein